MNRGVAKASSVFISRKYRISGTIFGYGLGWYLEMIHCGKAYSSFPSKLLILDHLLVFLCFGNKHWWHINLTSFGVAQSREALHVFLKLLQSSFQA